MHVMAHPRSLKSVPKAPRGKRSAAMAEPTRAGAGGGAGAGDDDAVPALANNDHAARAHAYLGRVGTVVRAHREQVGLTRRALADRAEISERFLAQLELGDGNISLSRFAAVAQAMGSSPAALLAIVEQGTRTRSLALLGVRGAGKSTVGALVAHRLDWPFLELDREIERAAGLSLAEIFEVHGEPYYRKLEREALQRLLAASEPMVIATGGSIVSDEANYALLRQHFATVWLRAKPEEHWRRVLAQGDARPMAQRPQAFEQLRALLASREAAYALAEYTVETSRRTPVRVAELVLSVHGRSL